MSGAPARLLLSGYFGFGNFGDEALLRIFVEEWRRRRPGDALAVLSARPEKTARTFGVQSVDRMAWKPVREAIRAADVVVSGGGGLLQTATSLRSLIYYAGIVRAAKRAGRKAALFAQGVGPLNIAGRYVVKRACAGVDLACVRDEASAALLHEVLPKLDVRVAADPVFLAATDVDAAADAALLERGLAGVRGELVAVMVRRAPMLDDAVKNISSAIDRLANRYGAHVVFIPLQNPADADAATAVIRRCRSAPMLLGGEYDLAALVALMSRCTAVVAMRLHALVLAARMSVPFAAVPYDPKIAALLAALRYPVPALDRNADPAAVVDALWSRRAELRAHLTSAAPPLAARASLAFDWLEELVSGS